MRKSQNKIVGSFTAKEPKIVKGGNIPEIPIIEGRGKHTQIAIHGIKQLFGDNTQLSLFSDAKVEEFSIATGLNLTNIPKGYGIDLNQSQSRVFEAILKAFSDSNYKGDELRKKATELKNSGININSSRALEIINPAYKNIEQIPVIKLTQSEIIKLAGYDRTRGDKTDVVEALNFLATKQFCFYWLRGIRGKKGMEKSKSGDYIKEEVMEVGTLLKIRYVKKEGEDILDYYEISPTACFLDQIKNYFLLFPENWREDVKQITGKKASIYTYKLLQWLRLQFEVIRGYNTNKGHKKKKKFEIKKSWEEVAITLKMPVSIYKANKPKGYKIIQEAYSVAIKLGYLVKVENNGATDILYLNELFYPKPGELV